MHRSFALFFTVSHLVFAGGLEAQSVVPAEVKPLAIRAVAALPEARAFTAYQATVTATGGVAPYVWDVMGGALPGGLSLNASTGTLSGTFLTPADWLTSSVHTFTLRVTDAAGASANRAFTLNVLGVVATLSVGNTVWADVNQNGLRESGEPGLAGLTVLLYASDSTRPMASTVTAAGGQYGFRNLNPGSYRLSVLPSATYSRASGSYVALDNGIDNDNNGLQTGGPGTPITSPSFTLAPATEPGSTGKGHEDSTLDFGLLPDGNASLAIQPAALGSATTGRFYSAVFNASGGASPYAWSLSAGSLPPGLTLQSITGLLSGTATAPGSYAFTVRAQDASGISGTRACTLEVVTPSLAISPAALPAGRSGAAYLVNLTATGGTAPFAWVVSAGSLPAGLTIHPATGAISGTPTVSGISSFTVRSTSSTGLAGSRSYQIIVSASQISISPATLPPGKAGSAYAVTLAASGGTAPYAWGISSGTLPAGLALHTGTGVISGTWLPPVTSGSALPNAGFTVQATDASGQKAYRSYIIGMESSLIGITPLGLSEMVAGQAMVPVTLRATGGTAPYAWNLLSGSLPAGLSLNSATGVLSGTPTTAGSFLVVFAATDANRVVGTRGYMMLVKPPGLVTISPATLPVVQKGVRYSALLSATGGRAPHAWALASGSLPPGLFLNASSGEIGGTVTPTGTTTTYPLRLRATSADGYIGQRDYLLLVTNPLVVKSETLPQAVMGTAYSHSFTASSGTEPYLWEITSGSLPSGLRLSSGGLLSGTPNINLTPTFTFTVRATDALGRTGQQSFTMRLVPLPLTLVSSATAPKAYVGVPFEWGIRLTGGVAPYYMDLVSGSLPPGLRLDVSGNLPPGFGLEFGGMKIKGVPESLGKYEAVVRFSDLRRTSIQVPLSFTVDHSTLSAPSFALLRKSMPEIGGALDDDDGDGAVNLLEYALGTPLDVPSGEASRFYVLKRLLADDPSRMVLEVSAHMPSVTRNDLRYQLELLDDLSGSPDGWRVFSPAPQVTFANLYPSYLLPMTRQWTWKDFAKNGAYPGPARGFARLRVSLDADLDGIPEATTVTSVFGWQRHQLPAGGSIALGMPFVPPASSLTSQVVAVNGAQLVLQAPNAGESRSRFMDDLRSSLSLGLPLFVEVLSGPAEGARMMIDRINSSIASSTTGSPGMSVYVDLASPQNTQATLPSSVVGSRVAIRRSWTIANAFDPREFNLRQSPNTAWPPDVTTRHRLSSLNADGATYATHVVQTPFTQSGQSYSFWADAASSIRMSTGDRLIAPGEGLIVRASSQEPLTFTLTGQVRANAFAQPLRSGPQLLANPWPMQLTPAQRRMIAASGFQPGVDASSADRVSTFEGTATGDVLRSYFLNGSAGSESWLPVEAGGAALVFPPAGAAYFIPLTSRPSWVQPCPWTP